jgi:hypothetical protein
VRTGARDAAAWSWFLATVCAGTSIGITITIAITGTITGTTTGTTTGIVVDAITLLKKAE